MFDSLLARESELERLRAALAARPAWLSVVGVPGVGKSHLVSAAVGGAEGTAWLASEGALTIDDVRERLGALGGLLAPTLVDALGMLKEAGRDTLVLDGCDTLTAATATDVAAACADLGMVVVATAWAQRGLAGEVVHRVAPMDRDAASQLFMHFAGSAARDRRSLPEGAIEALVDRADGLPAQLVLLGTRMRVYGFEFLRERFLDAPRPRPETLPAGIEAAFVASVGLLQPAEHWVLASFAVFAEPVGLAAVEDVLGPLWGPSWPAIVDALDALVVSGLVRQTTAGSRVEFVGVDMARRAASELVGAEGRLRLQRGYSTYLSTRDTVARPSVLRRMLERELDADAPLDVLTDLLWSLASRATRGTARPTDLAFAERSLARATADTPPATLDRLRLSQALFLLTDTRADEAEATLTEIVSRSGANEEPLLTAHAWEGLARADSYRLKNAAALGALTKARERFEQASRPRDVARVLHHVAGTLESLGRLDEARTVAVDAMARAAALGDAILGARVAATLGSIDLELGDCAQAIRRYGDALAVAQAQGEVVMSMIFEGYRGIAFQHAGDLVEAERTLGRAIAAARAQRRRDAEALFSSALAATQAYAGRIVEAEGLLHLAESMGEPFPLISGTVTIQKLHLRLARLLADARGAVTDVGELERRADGARHEVALAARAPAAGSATERLLDVSDDARIALRLLKAKLDLVDALVREQREGAPLEVLGEGRAFRTKGVLVSLASKPRLKRILHALAMASSGDPPRRCTPDELVAAGWPDGGSGDKAARNRLHVALAELRSLGLREALVKEEDGYRLENARYAAGTAR